MSTPYEKPAQGFGGLVAFGLWRCDTCGKGDFALEREADACCGRADGETMAIEHERKTRR